jgi:hypothetical protein
MADPRRLPPDHLAQSDPLRVTRKDGRRSRWQATIPRFWSLVEKGDDCWLWKGSVSGGGYGRITVSGKRVAAHRFSYEAANGPIPDGLFICHSCDVKLCVNPAHLFAGTQVDNMQDWTRKGKNVLVNDRTLWQRGETHWTHRESERARTIISESRKQEWASGRRTAIRDPKTGRMMGTRMVAA